MTEQFAADQLPLSVPVFQILLSVAGQELHGYAIIKDIRERTRGEVQLTASTLYDAIKRLMTKSMIYESEERPDEKDDHVRRRYYRITPFGRAVLQLETERLSRALRMARAELARSRP